MKTHLSMLVATLGFLSLTLAASPIAGGACAPGGSSGTLQDFIALGSSGCIAQSGVALVNWTHSPLNDTVSTALVTVSLPVDTAGQTVVQITSPFWNNTDGDFSSDIFWSWSLPDGWEQASVVVDFGPNVAPFSANYNIFENDTLGHHTAAANFGGLYGGDVTGSFSDGVGPLLGYFGGSGDTEVTTTAAFGGAFSVQSITATYDLAPVTTPEPAGLLLGGSSLLLLALLRRRLTAV